MSVHPLNAKSLLDVFGNAEVIALNQDAMGVQAFRASVVDGVEYWYKPLDQGDWALMILNRNPAPHAVKIDWASLHVQDEMSNRMASFGLAHYDLRDLWTGRFVGNTGNKPFVASVPGHDVLLLRLSRRAVRSPY